MILSLHNRFNNQCVKTRILYSRILLDQKSSGSCPDGTTKMPPFDYAQDGIFQAQTQAFATAGHIFAILLFRLIIYSTFNCKFVQENSPTN